MSTPVAGTCDPRFSAVEEEFRRNFSERGELGAAVCVLIDGVPVVDLAGGFVDARRSAPWSPTPSWTTTRPGSRSWPCSPCNWSTRV